MGIYDRDYMKPEGGGPSFGDQGRRRSGGGGLTLTRVLVWVHLLHYLLLLLLRPERGLGGPLTEAYAFDPARPAEVWRWLSYSLCYNPNELLMPGLALIALAWCGSWIERERGAWALGVTVLVAELAGALAAYLIDAGNPSADLRVSAHAGAATCALGALLVAPRVEFRVSGLALDGRWFALPLLVLLAGVPALYSLSGPMDKASRLLAHPLFSLQLRIDASQGRALERDGRMALAGVAAGVAALLAAGAVASWRRGRAGKQQLLKLLERPPGEPLAADDPAASPLEIEREADRVLDKLAKVGEAALTDAEREILKRASQHFRDKQH